MLDCRILAEPSVRVKSGPCTVIVDMNGAFCFRSGNYPYDYNVDESCTFQVARSAVLSVRLFVTEENLDMLTVNGQHSYSGTSGPDGLSVQAGESISWKADLTNEFQGFEICLAAESSGSPATASRSPTSRPGNSQHQDVRSTIEPRSMYAMTMEQLTVQEYKLIPLAWSDPALARGRWPPVES